MARELHGRTRVLSSMAPDAKPSIPAACLLSLLFVCCTMEIGV